MRIIQVIPSLEQRHGGPSRSAYEISRAIAEAGHEVDLFATGAGPRETKTEGSLTVTIFPRDFPRDLCPSSEMRARLRSAEADVIHHHSIWLRTLHYSRQASLRAGAPFVISPRGMMSSWSWNHHAWRKRLSRRFVHPGAFEAAAGWHATSPAESSDITARGFRQPVCLAPNGVRSPSGEDLESAATHWRELCPEAADHPVALFYSRFHRKKRVLELIDLWLEHGPRDWLLLLVGIPEDYEVEQLEDYVLRSLGSRRARVFSGAGHPPPYAVASLFLLPSHNENFGLAVGEALAAGVPALVTDTTPWQALNAAGGGWCVPWADYPAALDAAIAQGPAALRRRGEAAREWAVREFSWQKPAQALIRFYEQLKSSGPAPRGV